MESLESWERAFADPDKVMECCDVLGIPGSLGSSFCCILPGHEEKNPSAQIYREPRNGLYIYRDFHQLDGKPSYTLSQVRAAHAYGDASRLDQLSPTEHATWGLLLVIEAGVKEPATVNVPDLPPHASGVVKKVWESFIVLLQCRWTYEYNDPVMFSRQFASVWCGVVWSN